MKIRFLNQPKEVKLGDLLTQRLSEKFEKVWIVAGFVKDSGLDVLLPHLLNATENGSNVDIILGIDNKNTSKDMLSKLLNMGCNIRVHANREESKLETRIYAFESENGESYVYLSAAKLSEGGLFENKCVITEIIYEPEEKKEFNKVKISIENGANFEEIYVLDAEKLKKLAERGEIVSRITERKIPRISDIYKTSDTVEVGTQEYDESASSSFSNLVNENVDFDIDIDIDTNLEVKYQTSLGEEVEQKLFNKKEEVEEEKKVSSKVILGEKELDFDSMSSLIMQTNKIVNSGSSLGEIKIPNYIAEKMMKFLDYPDNFHVETDEKGKLKNMAKVSFKIVDDKEELNDENVQIYQTDKYIAVKSNVVANLKLEEGDIIRLIKQNKGNYTCEIIRASNKEYNIWENFCTSKMKGTSRKFGIM